MYLEALYQELKENPDPFYPKTNLPYIDPYMAWVHLKEKFPGITYEQTYEYLYEEGMLGYRHYGIPRWFARKYGIK